MASVKALGQFWYEAGICKKAMVSGKSEVSRQGGQRQIQMVSLSLTIKKSICEPYFSPFCAYETLMLKSHFRWW